MLSIAICDDSTADVEKIERLLEQIDNKPMKYDVFYNGQDLFDHRKECDLNYNLYILDIEMDQMDGLDIAKRIRKTDMKALIVFLTSFSSYVYNVFEVVTFDFIQKPITFSKLYDVLNKAENYLQLTRKNFIFNYKRRQRCINCEDIIYFEKSKRQAIIHTESVDYMCNMKVAEIWQQLDSSVFVHIHNSYIVNLEYIQEIERDKLYLKNGSALYISRNYKQLVREKHLLFMREKL